MCEGGGQYNVGELANMTVNERIELLAMNCSNTTGFSAATAGLQLEQTGLRVHAYVTPVIIIIGDILFYNIRSVDPVYHHTCTTLFYVFKSIYHHVVFCCFRIPLFQSSDAHVTLYMYTPALNI